MMGSRDDEAAEARKFARFGVRMGFVSSVVGIGLILGWFGASEFVIFQGCLAVALWWIWGGVCEIYEKVDAIHRAANAIGTTTKNDDV